jgi:hypothetical protein
MAKYIFMQIFYFYDTYKKLSAAPIVKKIKRSNEKAINIIF